MLVQKINFQSAYKINKLNDNQPKKETAPVVSEPLKTPVSFSGNFFTTIVKLFKKPDEYEKAYKVLNNINLHKLDTTMMGHKIIRDKNGFVTNLVVLDKPFGNRILQVKEYDSSKNVLKTIVLKRDGKTIDHIEYNGMVK